MCTPLPARVLSLGADTVLVESNGRPLQVSRPPLADIQPGDWVLVYLGQIVSCLEPEEAGALQELLQAIEVPWDYVGQSTAPPELES